MTDKIPDNHHVLEFPYTRTTGEIVGSFLTALRDGRILGSRIDGKVYCPPLEYHPETAAPVETDLVEIGPGGVVETWTWVEHPTSKHPFQEPFAFALIKLDGADTALPHAVKVSSQEKIFSSARVTARWRQDEGQAEGNQESKEGTGTSGAAGGTVARGETAEGKAAAGTVAGNAAAESSAITDIYFVLESEAGATPAKAPAQKSATTLSAEALSADPVTITNHLISLTIHEPLHAHRKRFAEGLLEGKIIGQRSPESGKIYVPGRGYDPIERVLITEADEVEITDVGTVVGFTEITPVQYHGQKETDPYIRCSILLDGSDQPVQGIDIRHIPVDDFRVGMRMKAVWKPKADRYIDDMDNRYGSIPETVVERWDPTGEPDVGSEQLKEHSM